MVLQTEDNCTASLKGTVFRKSKIHRFDSKGVPVEAWLANGEERTIRKFKEGDLYYKLKISGLRLYMNKGEAKDLEPGNSTELGTLRVLYNSGGGDQFMELPLSISVSSEGGTSTVLGCRVAASKDKCEGVSMTFNENKGTCEHSEVCDEWLDFAELPEGGATWEGERTGFCTDNVGSHVRDIKIAQAEGDIKVENSGMAVKCCFPKTMMSLRCFDFEEVAEYSAWDGDRNGQCDMKFGGQLQGLILSQGQVPPVGGETNGLMIRCCYPY
jgi:hypothetical protein